MLELIIVLLNEICKCCGLNVCLQHSYVEILTLKGISMKGDYIIAVEPHEGIRALIEVSRDIPVPFL